MSHSYYKNQGRKWRHPSVLELMKTAEHVGRPEERIVEKAKEIVAAGIKLGWSGPPFDPYILANILGIKTKQIDFIDAEAQIVPINGQFELQFRSDVANTRLNFTICHEIAHTLFPDCADMIHQRNTQRKSFDPDKEVEYLCDIGAAEILMPTPYFDNDLKNEGITLQAVPILAQRYSASREAVIRRIPSASPKPCAVVYLNLGFNKTELQSRHISTFPLDDIQIQKLKPRLRVSKVYPNNFNVFLPHNKSIPDDSVIYKLLSGEEYVSGLEQWDIEGFGQKLIEATRLYSTTIANSSYVIALVH